MLLDKPRAKKLVQIFLDKKFKIDNERIIPYEPAYEFDFGWLFYYDTKSYMDTGDEDMGVFVVTPILVDKNDSSLNEISPRPRVAFGLEEYRKDRGYSPLNKKFYEEIIEYEFLSGNWGIWKDNYTEDHFINLNNALMTLIEVTKGDALISKKTLASLFTLLKEFRQKMIYHDDNQALKIKLGQAAKKLEENLEKLLWSGIPQNDPMTGEEWEGLPRRDDIWCDTL